MPQPLDRFTDRMEALRTSTGALEAWQARPGTAAEAVVLLGAIQTDVRQARAAVPAMRALAAGIRVTENALDDVDSRLQATDLMLDRFLDLAAEGKVEAGVSTKIGEHLAHVYVYADALKRKRDELLASGRVTKPSA
jgi:hypothetical protein